MSYFLNFILISCIAAFTPGPNNSMLMQSGIYFGVRKTLPHVYGVIIGFSVLFLSVHLGIYVLLLRFPFMNTVLKTVGTVYFLYFAYKILSVSSPTKDSAHEPRAHARKPLKFWVAFFFQWINMKAWFFALSSIGTLPTQKTLFTVLGAQIVIIVVTAGSALAWTLGGVLIARAFKNPRALRIISVVLALSLVYIAIEQWI